MAHCQLKTIQLGHHLSRRYPFLGNKVCPELVRRADVSPHCCHVLQPHSDPRSRSKLGRPPEMHHPEEQALACGVVSTAVTSRTSSLPSSTNTCWTSSHRTYASARLANPKGTTTAPQSTGIASRTFARSHPSWAIGGRAHSLNTCSPSTMAANSTLMTADSNSSCVVGGIITTKWKCAAPGSLGLLTPRFPNKLVWDWCLRTEPIV